MNLVEYEFSSDEEEYEKETENKKLKDDKNKNKIFFEKKNTNILTEHRKEKNGESNCSNKEHPPPRKLNTQEIETNTKDNLHKDNDLNIKGDIHEIYNHKRWKKNRDTSDTEDVIYNKQKTNMQNNKPNEKTEENFIKPIRTSRWDDNNNNSSNNNNILKKYENKIYNSAINENSSDKVERVHGERKEFLNKKIENEESRRGTRTKEHLKEEQKKGKTRRISEVEVEDEGENKNEDAFFESNNLMNMDINEASFEDVFEQAPNEYSSSINKKLSELKKFYDMGLTINKHISESNEYNNPCILEKIMKVFEIEPYASNYPIHIFNSKDLDCIDLFNEKEPEKKTNETLKKSKWSSQN